MFKQMKEKAWLKIKSWIGFKTKVSIVLMVLVFGSVGVHKVIKFVNKYEFVTESPVSVHFQTPLYLVERAYAQNIIVSKQGDNLPLNENEKYLCQVFGDQCKNALMIQHLENGSEQCDRFHVNPNGTIDVGFMQINSIHLKKGYTLTDLADCRKNIDIAHIIYKSSGWGAWVTAKQLGIK